MIFVFLDICSGTRGTRRRGGVTATVGPVGRPRNVKSKAGGEDSGGYDSSSSDE